MTFNIRADSRFASSQWKTVLLCNDVSHWLGTSLGTALSMQCLKPAFFHFHNQVLRLQRWFTKWFKKKYLACICWPLCPNLNSLWPNNTIWWVTKSGSTLSQIMAFCLMAPIHYLDQCWILISEVLWHSPEGNFTASAHATILHGPLVWKLYFWHYCHISQEPMS